MSISAGLKKKVTEVTEWALAYLVLREDTWQELEETLTQDGTTQEEIATQKLCYNADSFHTVWEKLKPLKIQNAISDFFPTQTPESSGDFRFEYYAIRDD